MRIDIRWLPFCAAAAILCVSGGLYVYSLVGFMIAHVPLAPNAGWGAILQESQLAISVFGAFQNEFWQPIVEWSAVFSFMLYPYRGTVLSLWLMERVPSILLLASCSFFLYLVSSLLLENWVANAVVGPPSIGMGVVTKITPLVDDN